MSRPLLGDGRRAAGWRPLAALATVSFVALSVRVAVAPAPSALDAWCETNLVNHLTHRQLVLATNALTYGLPAVAIVVLATAIGWAWSRRNRAGAWLLCIGPAASVAIGEWIVKPLVNRPEGSESGFPSGHGLVVAGTATALVLVSGQRPPCRGARRAQCVVIVSAVLGLVGVIVLRYHYATDVLGSVLLACATVPCAAALIDRALHPALEPQPGAR